MGNNLYFWNHAFIYAFGFLGIRAVSFLLLPFYTNFLTPEVLGHVFLLITLLAFLNTIFTWMSQIIILKKSYI